MSPWQIADVVLTHAHPDHSKRKSLFPAAKPSNFPRTDLATGLVKSIHGVNQPKNAIDHNHGASRARAAAAQIGVALERRAETCLE